MRLGLYHYQACSSILGQFNPMKDAQYNQKSYTIFDSALLINLDS